MVKNNHLFNNNKMMINYIKQDKIKLIVIKVKIIKVNNNNYNFKILALYNQMINNGVNNKNKLK